MQQRIKGQAITEACCQISNIDSFVTKNVFNIFFKNYSPISLHLRKYESNRTLKLKLHITKFITPVKN